MVKYLMGYRYRLTFGSTKEGVFRFDTADLNLDLPDGKKLLLVARNADVLMKATSFHFEVKGYPDEDAARDAGNYMRLRLRVLNAMLGLGLNVPMEDIRSGGVNQTIKDDAFTEFGAVVVDSISGVSVFPDDEHHVEYVMGGHINVYPSEPLYALNGLVALYTFNLTLEQKSEDALQVLNLATHETSAKAAFMANYLALEPLVERKARSKDAIALLNQLRVQVADSGLDSAERNSLVGTLDSLRIESFKSALLKLADRIEGSPQIKGKPIKDFLAECVTVRNQVAHKVEVDSSTNFQELNEGLRQFALSLIWTFSGIPDITVDVPASALSIPEGAMTFRVL